MLLSDGEIRDALEEGDIVIDPPVPDEHIEPASVDFALGREAYRAGDDQRTMIEDGEILRLPAGSMAIVLTRETIELRETVAGSIGLRSKYTRKGVDLLAGPQIDPGFSGPLHLTLINLSPSTVTLSEGERFCTVEFHRLPERATRGYDGAYQSESRVTSEEIRDLENGDYTLDELHRSMSTIAKNVEKMEQSVDRLEDRTGFYMRIFVATVVALAGTIVGSLILLLIPSIL